MIVKLCGIKTAKGMAQAESSGINWIGINFYRESSRYLSFQPEDISLSGNVKRVGVFVDETESNILKQVKAFDLDYVQLHGNESASFCRYLMHHIRIIKAIPIAEKQDIKVAAEYDFCSYLLFDFKSKNHGGSGKKFDWSILKAYNGPTPFILAGGISSRDAYRIRNISNPYLAGVDLNSRFETEPGVKNYRMVRTFLNHLKNNFHEI